MLRRVAAPALLAVALICAALSWSSLSTADAAPADSRLNAAVFSPRRIPEVLAQAEADAALRAAIRNVQSRFPLGQGSASCLVVHRDGRPIVADNTDSPLVPASTLKILTAAAALRHLGPEQRFSTQVHRNHGVENGVLTGPLYLKGGGDPLIATPQFVANLVHPPAAYTPIDALAEAVAGEGIRLVTGGLVVDDDYFDAERSVASWNPAYQSQGQVGALGALVVNNGFGPPPAGRSLSPDPGVDLAAALRDALAARGVQVEGGTLRGNTPTSSKLVADVPSPPLKAIVAHMLTASDNTVAEVLLKQVAVAAKAEANTAAGAAHLQLTLRESGLPTKGLVAADGSGLSRANRASCRLIEATLRNDGPAGVVHAGLPIAGESGTLEDRLESTPAERRLRAKTGSLSDVSGLAGWSVGQSGAISFAVLANDVSPTAAHSFEDQLAIALATPPPLPSIDKFAFDAEGPR